MKIGFGVKAKLKSIGSGTKINGNKIKAVLFDMDGVLIDSVDIWLKAFNSTLKEFGNPVITKGEFVENYWGKSVDENILLLSRKFHNSRLNENAMKFCKIKIKEFYPDAKIFPYAKEIVIGTKKKFKTALVTNTPRHDVFGMLKKHNLEKYFDVVLSIEDVENGKPDPEMIKKACKILRVKPKNAMLIGDTENDMIAGKVAGCNLLGVGVDGDEQIEEIYDVAKILELKI